MLKTQTLVFSLIAAISVSVSAAPATDEALIAKFSSIAMPIAKGAVLEDSKGCFWWVRNGEKNPEVVALVDDQTGGQLCQARKPSLAVANGQVMSGGARE